MNGCALQSGGCRGRLEWHHAIKQQRIKRAFPRGAALRSDEGPPYRATSRHEVPDPLTDIPLDEILGDPRNRVVLCSHHHELVTNGRLEPPLPDSVWEFADEFGLRAQLENDLARRAA